MRLYKNTGLSCLLLMIACTCLVAGVAGAPSSADGGSVSEASWEPNWHLLRSAASDNANGLALHPLLQWNGDFHQLLNPGIKERDSLVTAAADPPEELLSSADYPGEDLFTPGFIQNVGQYDPAVAFVLQYQGTTVFFTREMQRTGRET